MNAYDPDGRFTNPDDEHSGILFLVLIPILAFALVAAGILLTFFFI